MTARGLLLAAHGSDQEPGSNQLVERHARAAQRLAGFDEAVAAFHQGSPSFSEGLEQLTCTEITVVPFMTSEGYYCNELLPQKLAEAQRFAMSRVHQTPPVGTHPRICDLVLEQLTDLSRRYAVDPERASVLIVGHGTQRNSVSRESTEHLAENLENQSPFRAVSSAFLDDDPTVGESLSALETETVIVVPFLLGLGPHVTDDVPRQLGITPRTVGQLPTRACINGMDLIVDIPVGMYDDLAEIVADLASSGSRVSAGVHRAVSRSTLRLGTRDSRMALWQANSVASRMKRSGFDVEIVQFSTTGDRIQDRPIVELPGSAPFSEDIENALRSGEVDFAVHCLKDLPVQQATDPLSIAAVLRRDELAEALITRQRCKLHQLPRGSRVGTSSPRRAAQLLSIRPDLQAVNLRGPVEQRVRAVREGELDAAILAVAGLSRLQLLGEIDEILPVEEFVPAPAQGALALQVRADDRRTFEACAPLEHRETRLAVTAELEFLRPYELNRRWVAAAVANTNRHHVHLHARLIEFGGQNLYDTRISGSDPRMAAQEAIQRLVHKMAGSMEVA